MSVFYNKKLISGVREVPKMTLAEYNALTNKPDVWVRTDAPDSDRGITASDVEYSTGVSVKDEIDTIGFKKLNPTSAQQDLTIDYSNCVQIDKTVFVDMLITTDSSSANNRRLVSGLPKTVSQDNFQFWGIEVKAYPNFSTTPIGFRIYNANNSGGIYPNTAISAGQFHIYGSYITSD